MESNGFPEIEVQIVSLSQNGHRVTAALRKVAVGESRPRNRWHPEGMVVAKA